MASKLPLISLETILAEPLPPPSWLVEPLISNGSRVVVYGEWGSYKSWGLLDLGLSISARTAWLEKFPIPSTRRVLYVDEEMSERVLRRRIKRLASGMEATSPATFRALSRQGIRLTATGATKLLASLQESDFDPEVIIVETLRRVFVGNENEAKDVAEFWRVADVILKAGKTLIVSHHMKKPSANGGNDVKHRASGSTDILGGADDALAFARRAKDAFTVEHVKCRDGEEVEPFAVGLDDAEEIVTLRHEGTLAEAKARVGKAAQARRYIENFLRAAPEKTARTKDILAHKPAGISDRTVEAALEDMKASGCVVSPEKGTYQWAAV